MSSVKLVGGIRVRLTGGTSSIPELTSIPWYPLFILLMTGSDMVADEVDGVDLWGSREMDEVVGGSWWVRGSDMQIFKKSRGYMGLWGGNPLAFSDSTFSSYLIGTPILNCSGGSSPVRSTTGLDPATLALFAFGAIASFTSLLFPTNVVVAGGW